MLVLYPNFLLIKAINDILYFVDGIYKKKTLKDKKFRKDDAFFTLSLILIFYFYKSLKDNDIHHNLFLYSFGFVSM